MNCIQKKDLFTFVFWGLLISFIIKNLLSIFNNSHGGDPIYIISNPSIDQELYFLVLFSYIISVKNFFPAYFNCVVKQAQDFEYLKNSTHKFKLIFKRINIGTIIKLLFFILALLFNIFSISYIFYMIYEERELVDWINITYYIYITLLVNRQFLKKYF